MNYIGDNASLGSDLDCKNQSLNNILHFYPTPPGLVGLTDPRLSDPRLMLPGSVINESVAQDAAIVQNKLNLNGVMPPAWFSTPIPPAGEIDAPAPPAWAARGDLAELTSRKGAVNGYAALDANRRLLPANVTPGAGLGTVSEVLFSFPSQFVVSLVTGGSSITCTTTWRPVANNTWFGTNGDVGLPGLSSGPGLTGTEPQFYDGTLPMDLIPPIDASKFTTGLFDPETLPVAASGENHSSGIVPDPGLQGDPYEYLGRDMEFHHFLSGPSYQPQADAPSITLNELLETTAQVTIRSSVAGSVLFYRAGQPSFVEAPPSGPDIHITITVLRGTLVEGYVAKQGYNNSDVASYTVPLPDSPLLSDDNPPETS